MNTEQDNEKKENKEFKSLSSLTWEEACKVLHMPDPNTDGSFEFLQFNWERIKQAVAERFKQLKAGEVQNSDSFFQTQ
jgi:hypothetical protein